MNPDAKLSDEELLARLQSTKQSNLVGIIYQRYSHLVLGTCLFYLKDGPLAQDAAMDIFENLVNNMHKYQVNKLKPWLLIVAKNHCLKLLARVIKKENQLFNKNIDANSMEINQVVDINTEQVFDDLEIALENLKEHQQKCIILFYLKGKSYEEISAKTGYEINKVKSYIQNGKLNLSKRLHRYNEGKYEY